MIMNVYAPIILCFVPFVTMFALFAILVPGISVAKEIIASIAGLLALIPIAIVQFAVPGMRLFGQSKALSILLYSILFLGLVEETFKALLLFIVGGKEEKISCWFCYSLLAGIIFGSFESVIYFLRDFQIIGHGVTLNLIYLRMFTAVLTHTLCAGLGGFTIYYFKNFRLNIWPLMNAILIHGLYDYFVSFDTNVQYFCVIVLLSAAIKCRVCYLQISEELKSKKSAGRTIIDPNKTVEMPKNPAIIIPVNNSVQAKSFEEDVADEDAEDYDQIEREAKSQLKAAKKIRGSSPRMTEAGKSKSAAKKPAAKKAAPAKKTAEKAPAKKPAAKTKSAAKPKTRAAQSASKKTAAKKDSRVKPANDKGKSKKPAAKKPASKGKK